ncbi:hypothetical protein [Agrobacterium sp. ST15.13.015]|uniref:hypothetical protein n=1 Tax=Agrobacterium sp. ST15.13.015 TaxID=3017319 RepID=UPI0022C500FC|nr:hypothetical protein [Agrobacterium sp. ST15.13.015]MCZ7498867.1 hypothetical protein [Rhizobium rhizogenes]
MDLSFHNRTLTISMQVKERIRRTGYTPSGFKVWTAEEDEIVKSLYPLYAEMQLRFPERSLKALHGRCERLGIAKKLHWWTGAEISKLRRLYPTASRVKIREEFPRGTWRAIEAAAKRHGMSRARRKYKRTGHHLIDAILARIEEIGWTLPDLDEEARTKKYFSNQGWRRSRPNIAKIALAVKALDGRLAIAWN